MNIVYEVRFKINHENYCFLKGLAAFYYDHRVIPRPTVHCLAKSATIIVANDWLKQQSIALEARKQRQQTKYHIANYKINRPSPNDNLISDYSINQEKMPVQSQKQQLKK